MGELERTVILDLVDHKWREHLYEMDYVEAGIGLRAAAERDPVVEYRCEGYDMYLAMLAGLEEECVAAIFHWEVTTETPTTADSSDDAEAQIHVSSDEFFRPAESS